MGSKSSKSKALLVASSHHVMKFFGKIGKFVVQLSSKGQFRPLTLKRSNLVPSVFVSIPAFIQVGQLSRHFTSHGCMVHYSKCHICPCFSWLPPSRCTAALPQGRPGQSTGGSTRKPVSLKLSRLWKRIDHPGSRTAPLLICQQYVYAYPSQLWFMLVVLCFK